MSDYESNRLFALEQLNLLDTPPSERFDRITRVASRMFDLPIAAVSLVDRDRLWFKSRIGIDEREIPRYKACCGEVAETAETVIIPDLLATQRYSDSLLAQTGLRFYAGAPLTTREGYILGSMCVLGSEPREISDDERAILGDLAAMVMTQIELEHAVGRVDAVTGLANYQKLVDDLTDVAEEPDGAPCYVLGTELIDVSEASTVQRVMGPSYLDDLACEAARVLAEATGDVSRIYYTGVCQFAHVLRGSEAEARAYGDFLRRVLSNVMLHGASPFLLSPAVGIARFRSSTVAPRDALRMAHSAVRDARADDTPVACYSAATDARHQRSYDLLDRFRVALGDNQQLDLDYQPRLAAVSGACTGVEALLRWRDPELGAISPAEFMPLVEGTPWARELTDWVLQRAIDQVASWRAHGGPARISVNIVAANLEESDFSRRLLAYLGQANVATEALEIELTEGRLMGSSRRALGQLERLIEAGVSVAIDDFGTGYSSLAYLRELPAQVVKIDRIFVAGVETCPKQQALLNAMISIAHELGFRVVAEGVETAAAHAFIAACGVEEIQGFYLAQPTSAEELPGVVPAARQRCWL